MALLHSMVKICRPLFYRGFSSTTGLNQLYYTQDHETIQCEDNTNIVKIGISDYAKESLGDIVFFESEVEVDEEIEVDDTLVLIESVKASSEIISPFSGRVVEINGSLEIDDLNTINEEDFWFIRCEIDDMSILDTLMCIKEYSEFTKKK